MLTLRSTFDTEEERGPGSLGPPGSGLSENILSPSPIYHSVKSVTVEYSAVFATVNRLSNPCSAHRGMTAIMLKKYNIPSCIVLILSPGHLLGKN